MIRKTHNHKWKFLKNQKEIRSICNQEREEWRESNNHTASGLPISLATVEVASERMEEVSIPSRLTLVEMFRQGIFHSSYSLLTLQLSVVRNPRSPAGSIDYRSKGW